MKQGTLNDEIVNIHWLYIGDIAFNGNLIWRLENGFMKTISLSANNKFLWSKITLIQCGLIRNVLSLTKAKAATRFTFTALIIAIFLACVMCAIQGVDKPRVPGGLTSPRRTKGR